MNVNFSVYLEDLRLTEAAHLIEKGESGINEIALEVGYNNQTSFRRAFKEKIWRYTKQLWRSVLIRNGGYYNEFTKKVLQKVLASHPDAFFTFWIVYKKNRFQCTVFF